MGQALRMLMVAAAASRGDRGRGAKQVLKMPDVPTMDAVVDEGVGRVAAERRLRRASSGRRGAGAGRSQREGLGASRQMTENEASELRETRLHAKRRRVLPPPQPQTGPHDHGYVIPSAATDALPPRDPPSPAVYDDQPVPSTSAASTAPSPQPNALPSPAVFTECDMSWTPRTRQLLGSEIAPTRDMAIMAVLLHYGSEEELESDEEEGGRLMVGARVRTCNQEMAEDTKQDIVAASSMDIDVAAEVVDGVSHEPTTMFDFRWHAYPTTPVSAWLRREQFVGVSGPMIDPIPNIYDAFVAIWDRTIMEHIVRETNFYAQQYCEELLSQGEISPTSRITLWKDTDVDEVYTFFGLLMAMGLTPKAQLKDYWLGLNTPNHTLFFSSIMPLKRFQILCKCLHFNRNDSPSLANLTLS